MHHAAESFIDGLGSLEKFSHVRIEPDNSIPKQYSSVFTPLFFRTPMYFGKIVFRGEVIFEVVVVAFKQMDRVFHSAFFPLALPVLH